MCTPHIIVNPKGTGFIYRKGGEDWDILGSAGEHPWFLATRAGAHDITGAASTIDVAVDNALAKLRASSPQEDK